MKKLVFDTAELAAGHAADTVAALLAQKPDAVLCLAAGHTSLPVFEAFLRRGLDFSRARFVGLDEWVGVGPEVEGSSASFLERNFFSKANVRRENIRLFNALAQDLTAECAAVERQIADWGGIDYLLLGMGMNGHLALNEPGDSFEHTAHVAELSETTKTVAPKYFAADMPPLRQGITLGVADFLRARRVQLTVFGAAKAPMVARLLELGPTTDLPATALHLLPEAELLLDAAAAGA